MAVSIRGSVGFVSNPSGAAVTIAWPAGCQVGDVVVAELDDAQPSPPGAGWFTIIRNVYSRFLSAEDLAAGGFTVRCRLYGLVVFAGSQGTGRTSYQNGVSVKAGGAGLYLAWSDPYDPVSVMGSPAGQIGGIVRDRFNNWNSMAVRLATADGYLQSTANPPRSFSVEIVPTAAPPAPLLSVPAKGEQVDQGLPVGLGWAHQGASPQEAYRVQVRNMADGVWKWLDASGARQTSEQTVSSSVSAATMATPISGTYYEWKVATKSGGLWSDYSSAGWFFPAAKPVVSSVAPAMPAESMDGTVSFTASASSGALVAWQVAVTPAAATSPVSPMLLSPVTQISTADTTFTTGIPVLDWVNGAQYKVWARVQQGGGLWSDWTAATFTVNWTPPAAPTGVAGVDGAPMQCVVSGVPAGKDVEAQWSMDGGVSWSPLGVQVAPGTAAVFDHPLAPYGEPVAFRARSLSIIDGVGLSSAWTLSGPAVSYDLGSYFVADDGAWIAAPVAEAGEERLVQGVAVTYGLGSQGARVDKGLPQGRASSLTVDCADVASREALKEWITTREVWIHRPHPEYGDDGHTDTEPVRMSAASPVRTSRYEQVAITDRTISFDWVEQP